VRSATQSASTRQRARDLRSDLPTILGGLALAGAVLLLYALMLGYAYALGVAQTWPAVSWVALAALGLTLLSLLVLFVRDYVRWRRTVARTGGHPGGASVGAGRG
jgi:hypothetical protein